MDRRALVFLGLALVCFALAPIGLPEHRYLAVGLGGVYVVLALLSLLDARSKASSRQARRRSDR